MKESLKAKYSYKINQVPDYHHMQSLSADSILKSDILSSIDFTEDYRANTMKINSFFETALQDCLKDLESFEKCFDFFRYKSEIKEEFIDGNSLPENNNFDRRNGWDDFIKQKINALHSDSMYQEYSVYISMLKEESTFRDDHTVVLHYIEI
jgi:hypothetical protein